MCMISVYLVKMVYSCFQPHMGLVFARARYRSGSQNALHKPTKSMTMNSAPTINVHENHPKMPFSEMLSLL